MRNDKPNTYLNNYTKTFGTAKLNKYEMTAYAASLAGKEIPNDSCLKKLYIEQTNTTSTIMRKGVQPEEHQSKNIDRLAIRPILDVDTVKCDAAKQIASEWNTPAIELACADAIAKGKCVDPFVIENIGIKFFPNMYKKEH